MSKKLKRDALNYHSKGRKGKIEVIPTKSHSSQRDLALAYSPGVAEPCLEIQKDSQNAYKYTAKGNLVAVISNGTAVLGLGDIGAVASKPVMEGKGLLFKIFADIDVFDIEVDETDVDAFIKTVKAIAPTFGGINLEDLKAPEAFEIESRLKEELKIPIMHDDQHGTAIISAAALLNALEIANKKIDEVKIVVSGAGSAAMSCIRMYVKVGAKIENIYMFDVDGLLSIERTELTALQKPFAKEPLYKNTAEAMVDADVFLGLSAGNLVTPEMVQSMAENPIVFALANPIPEIDYRVAVKSRKDIIMGTGRSDFPNQINNVLGFPYIFRGALDVRATTINEEMKLAAVHALAELAKTPVPDMVNLAYNKKNLTFGRDYFIPKPFDTRLMTTLSPAVAKAAMETGVAQNPIKDWDKYEEELLDRISKDNKLIRMMQNRAKTNPKRILFSNAEEYDVLKAAQVVAEEGIGIPVFLGEKERIEAAMEKHQVQFDVEIIDQRTKENQKRRDEFAKQYWEQRSRSGVTLYDAKREMDRRDYFGAMLVDNGIVDTMITGYSRSYEQTLRPLLSLIGPARGVKKVCGLMLLMTKKGPLFLADTSVIKDPTAEDLSRIAKMVAGIVKNFGFEPRIAMLSYTNYKGTGESKKVKEAVEYLHKKHPDLKVDGEIQPDFALNYLQQKKEYPFSKLGGNANVMIFPDLASGNLAYKLLTGVTEMQSIGPILVGLKKPIHILQMKASVDQIVNLATLAVLDVQMREELKFSIL